MERGKLFEIKIDLVTTDPRAGPEVMRGEPFHWPAAAGHLPSLGHEKGKEQNEFHKSNVSMDQLSKFFHHPPGKVAKNRFLPHHRLSTRPGHTFLFTLFPPVPEFPQFRESFVAKKWLRDRTSWEIR